MTCLNITKLREHQIRPIQTILDRKDCLMIAPTSSGKSAVFQIPAMTEYEKSRCWTLVIAPTISLIRDQVQHLQKKGIAAEYCCSSNVEKHREILSRLASHQITLLYVTPERLQSPAFLQIVQVNCPWLVVVDEAHCILDWGYTFRRSYLLIGKFLNTLRQRPVITAFTATAPPEYRKEICSQLSMKRPKCFVGQLERSNLTLLLKDCHGLKIARRLDFAYHFIQKHRKDGKVILYCASRKNVDMLFNFLSKRFPGEVVKCHAYMDSGKREKHEKQFISGTKPIMVASSAFGMGVDASDVRLIIHFNLPLNVMDYYQQIGRAGRDGQKSKAVLLYDRTDIDLCRFILDREELSKPVRKWLFSRLDEMVTICESQECLYQQVLRILGETEAERCGRCTNCQRARRKDNET